ncbi:CinA family protein [Methylosoma difficile]
MENGLEALARQLGEQLLAKQQTMATAESCTGGWIAQTLTSIPGSSAWFDRGFVTYSNAAKIDMLGVDPQIVDTSGAVSAETALAMVTGALAHSTADLAVAVTGIAGPGGGSAEKPVGLVYLAWQWRGDAPVVVAKQFQGDRQQIRLQTVATALAGALA